MDNEIKLNEIYHLDLGSSVPVKIKTWVSISAAEKELKIYNITSVCKGKQKTAGGYVWKYKND